ncbi:MAG: hypothetical protein LUC19_05390, partial [Oscillospiraceae bacterium]|nr:hypothetical protein [Oscillospiraceae bacterium]
TSSLVIDSGYTLVIPTSADASDTLTGNNASGAVSNLAEGIKLTMTGDASITVNGTLLVAGNQQSTTGNAGCLTGSYGVIDMASASNTITINDGGALYARGEISGEGTVTANNGATVYQLFQIHDWRGGTASVLAYGSGVFPFNLYEIKNISAQTVYNNGASLIAQAYIYASGAGYTNNVIIIGTGGYFEFDEAASLTSGSIEFARANDVTEVTVNGTVDTNDLKVTLPVNGEDSDISSATTVCPFGYNMNVTVADGAVLTITNNFKFLPGCTITVDEGAVVSVDADNSVYFYTADTYLSTNNAAAWTSTADAALVNNGGTVNAAKDGYGTIACASDAFTNVDGFEADETTVTIGEYRGGFSATPVTFY